MSRSIDWYPYYVILQQQQQKFSVRVPSLTKKFKMRNGYQYGYQSIDIQKCLKMQYNFKIIHIA